jgi:hypothetical protein
VSVQAPWKDLLAEPLARDHVVQLYRDERFLAEAVALFAGVGIGKADAVILVATPSHVAAIEKRLASEGFDLDGLKRWGQLTVLDAAATLSRFMVDGMPDETLFKSLIGDAIAKARQGGRYRRVRAYGEMVNLLWKDNLPAATRLEELWNDVIQAQSISLFCAYGLDREGEAQKHFPVDLRTLHSLLIPVEACA